MEKLKLVLISLFILFISGCVNSEIDFKNESIPVNVTNELIVSNKLQLKSYEPIYRFLDTNGNHTGLISGIGDYSTTSQDFYIKPLINETYYLSRLIISIEDSGTFDSGSYGNGLTLTNGITLWFEREGIKYNLTNSQPILTNGQWGSFAYDVDLQTFGSGNQFLNIRLTFEKAGQPIILHGYHNDSLGVNLNDDFTDLVNHKYHVQGFIIPVE